MKSVWRVLEDIHKKAAGASKESHADFEATYVIDGEPKEQELFVEEMLRLAESSARQYDLKMNYCALLILKSNLEKLLGTTETPKTFKKLIAQLDQLIAQAEKKEDLKEDDDFPGEGGDEEGKRPEELEGK